MKKSIVATIVALTSLNAAAQSASSAPSAAEINWGLMQQSSENQKKLEEAMQSAKESMNTFQKNMPNQITPEMLETGAKSSRLIDDIANETTQKQRKDVLASLGINDDKSALYYFLSWSMPIEVMRAYVVDAMWSGGTVVFKGIPKGEDLGTFMNNNMQELVYGKSAAYLSIDPRLYDMYDIQAVPAIVLTSYREIITCKGDAPKTVTKEDGTSVTYEGCKPLDDSKYYKISGSVTGSYALQTFVDKGATYGVPYLNAIKKGWSNNQNPGEAQKPFTGSWESVLTPEQQQAVTAAKESFKTNEILKAVPTP